MCFSNSGRKQALVREYVKLRRTAWCLALCLVGLGASAQVRGPYSAFPVNSSETLSYSATHNSNALPDAPSSSALTDRQKFEVFRDNAVSPLTFAGAGMNAAVMQARSPYGVNYSWTRSYTAALAQRESNQFFSSYLFPKLFNQDPRYHPASTEKTMGRAVYAASRVLITRKDDGSKTLNTSYLLGTLLTSSLANAYRPYWARTASNTFSDVGSTIGGDAGFNVFREFWPQVSKTLSSHTPKSFKKIGEKFSGDDKREAGSDDGSATLKK
jgi:hypothetical protein